MKMRIKHLTLSAIIILSSLAVQAQIGFGILGGVNFQNINGKSSNGTKLENGLLTGFHAGVSVNIPIAADFYFQPGLLFSLKGSNNEFYSPPAKASGDYTTTTRLSYVELPLNLLFRPQLGNGHILLGFGPYIAYGITGKETTQLSSISIERPVKFKNSVENWTDLVNNAYYRPFDAGANIFFGYEFSMGAFVQLNAQLGLLKINPEYPWISDDQTAYKNTGYGLSLGYRF
ncbi:MAG: porin family protein [Bacteroidales bacterium]